MRCACGSLALAMLSVPASAQYEAVILTHDAQIFAAYGGQQFGSYYYPDHAASWSGTAESLVDHDPSGEASEFYGANGGNAVGWRFANSMHTAKLYYGATDSWVDLDPGGYTYTTAHAIYGNSQVGYGSTSGTDVRALLWHSSAASVVDLTPAGIPWASATGVYGDVQAGNISNTTSDLERAVMWRGTAASMVELQPAGALKSHVSGMYGDQIVGYTVFPGSPSYGYATIWSATDQSATFISPPGWEWAEILGTDGVRQVGEGEMTPSTQYHALTWAGTADSYIDLNDLLPSDFYTSYATSIDPITGEIGGFAESSLTGRHAVIWRPVPEPASLLGLAIGALTLSRRRRSAQP